MEVLHFIRDVAIIILALETIIIGAAVLFLVLQVWKLVGIARRYLETFGTSGASILGSVQETARTTQGTAEFVADRTARPVIELYSAVAGASRFAQAVFGRRQPSDREGEAGREGGRR